MRQWIVVGLLLGMAAPAWAMSSAAGAAGGTSSAGSAGSSASSDSSSDNDKLVLDARVDAASFVASDGAIRGARLEAERRGRSYAAENEATAGVTTCAVCGGEVDTLQRFVAGVKRLSAVK